MLQSFKSYSVLLLKYPNSTNDQLAMNLSHPHCKNNNIMMHPHLVLLFPVLLLMDGLYSRNASHHGYGHQSHPNFPFHNRYYHKSSITISLLINRIRHILINLCFFAIELMSMCVRINLFEPTKQGLPVF